MAESTFLISREWQIAIVHRLVENAKRMGLSGVYLSVEEIEAVMEGVEMFTQKQEAQILRDALATYVEDHRRSPQNLDATQTHERTFIIGEIRKLDEFIHRPEPKSEPLDNSNPEPEPDPEPALSDTNVPPVVEPTQDPTVDPQS